MIQATNLVPSRMDVTKFDVIQFRTDSKRNLLSRFRYNHPLFCCGRNVRAVFFFLDEYVFSESTRRKGLIK